MTEPVPVGIRRATVIDVGEPFGSEAAAGEWLASAGEEQLGDGLAVINRALLAHRVLNADPYINPVARHQVLVARVGYGAGEEVAEGRWRQALELTQPEPRWPRGQRRRRELLSSQASLPLALSGRRQPLIAEELALRATLDLDLGNERAAALQLGIALDAALAELAHDPAAADLASHIEQLRSARPGVGAVATAALTGVVSAEQRAELERTLSLLQRSLRARAAIST